MGLVHRGGGGVLWYFYAYVGSGPASALHPKKYQEFQAPQKIFEILATKKNTPPFCTLTLRKDPKKDRNYTKYSLILWWTPKNIHKIFIPPKNIYFSEKPQKILKLKIFNPKQWPEPTYAWKYQSTPPPPPGLIPRKPCFWWKLIICADEPAHYRLMQVKSMAECSKGSILQYFRTS